MHNTLVIGLTGRAGGGKDAFATMLGYQTYAFAGPLKAALAAMGFPEPPRKDKELMIPGFEFSWRRAAQTLGTEWGRNLQSDIWLAMAKRFHYASRNDFLVITDVRFHNEADWVREHGVLVHLQGRMSDMGNTEQRHASEAGLPVMDGDYLVDNSGTLTDLRVAATNFERWLTNHFALKRP